MRHWLAALQLKSAIVHHQRCICEMSMIGALEKSAKHSIHNCEHSHSFFFLPDKKCYRIKKNYQLQSQKSQRIHRYYLLYEHYELRIFPFCSWVRISGNPIWCLLLIQMLNECRCFSVVHISNAANQFRMNRENGDRESKLMRFVECGCQMEIIIHTNHSIAWILESIPFRLEHMTNISNDKSNSLNSKTATERMRKRKLSKQKCLCILGSIRVNHLQTSVGERL